MVVYDTETYDEMVDVLETVVAYMEAGLIEQFDGLKRDEVAALIAKAKGDQS